MLGGTLASEFSTYWRNTKEMPELIGLACRGAMVAGPVLLIVLLIPGIDWNVNGRPMSYSEVWRSGVGASALSFIVFVTIGAWGMAARKQWSRWVLVLTQVVPVVFFPIDWKEMRGHLPIMLIGVGIGVAIIYTCLFRLKRMRSYFEDGAQ